MIFIRLGLSQLSVKESQLKSGLREIIDVLKRLRGNRTYICAAALIAICVVRLIDARYNLCLLTSDEYAGIAGLAIAGLGAALRAALTPYKDSNEN